MIIVFMFNGLALSVVSNNVQPYKGNSGVPVNLCNTVLRPGHITQQEAAFIWSAFTADYRPMSVS